MAVLHLPHGDEFDRVQSLGRIARVILAVRIVCCLLATLWVAQEGATGVAVGLALASAWLLFVLRRWDSVGVALSTHPLLLFVDTGLCLAALLATAPMTPLLLLIGSGGVLTGLCLGRMGAIVFSPILAGGWFGLLILDRPEPDEMTDAFTLLVVMPVILIGLLFLGNGIRDVVLGAAESERDRRRQLRSAGVAEERARLAREMHDSLVKSLHGIALLADGLPKWLDRDPERAKEQARTMAQLIHETSDSSRSLILAMRRADATANLVDQARAAVKRWEHGSERPVTFVAEGEPELGVESTYELVAMLNEALENVTRHTPRETSVDVRLSADEAWVSLKVTDSGPGLPDDVVANGHTRPGHFGLVGMRERAARVGGRASVSSVATGGTTVHITIPASLFDDSLEEAW